MTHNTDKPERPICVNCDKEMIPQVDPFTKQLSAYIWHCDNCMPSNVNLTIGGVQPSPTGEDELQESPDMKVQPGYYVISIADLSGMRMDTLRFRVTREIDPDEFITDVLSNVEGGLIIAVSKIA